MTVYIKKLLREIFNEIKNNQPKERVVTYLVMYDKLSALEKSSIARKQEQMIYLVLGAIFNDLLMKKIKSPLVDDYYAQFNTLPLTYQNLEHFRQADGKRVTLDELFCKFGEYVFSRITQSPKGKHDLLALFHPGNRYGKSFPNASWLALNIQHLVGFCISHQNSLEIERIETNHYTNTLNQESSKSFQIKEVEPDYLKPTNDNLGLLILGGFITALGITAVALAFTALSASTLGMSFVAIAGFAGLIGGLGLLSRGIYKHHQYIIDESLERLIDLDDQYNTYS